MEARGRGEGRRKRKRTRGNRRALRDRLSQNRGLLKPGGARAVKTAPRYLYSGPSADPALCLEGRGRATGIGCKREGEGRRKREEEEAEGFTKPTHIFISSTKLPHQFALMYVREAAVRDGRGKREKAKLDRGGRRGRGARRMRTTRRKRKRRKRTRTKR